MPPIVMPPVLRLQAAIPDDGAQCNGADDLHGRQEEGRQPGCAVAGAVHLSGQLAEFAHVFVFTSQGFDHPHTGDVFVVCAGDLRIELAHLAIFSQDALAELDATNNNDRHHCQDDQRQAPVDEQHEIAVEVKIFTTAQVESSSPQVTRSATRSVSEVTRDMIQPTGVLAVIRQRKVLQMVEQLLAQIIANALAEDAGQINKTEDQDCLDQDQGCRTGSRCSISAAVSRAQDALIDDPFAQEGEVSIQNGYKNDADQESSTHFQCGRVSPRIRSDGLAVELGLNSSSSK